MTAPATAAELIGNIIDPKIVYRDDTAGHPAGRTDLPPVDVLLGRVLGPPCDLLAGSKPPVGFLSTA